MKNWKKCLIALLSVSAVITVFAVSSVEANFVQFNQVRVVGASVRSENSQEFFHCHYTHQQRWEITTRAAGSATVVVSGGSMSVWLQLPTDRYPSITATATGTAGTGISPRTSWIRTGNWGWMLIPGFHAW